jgi:hypothetical protein
MMDLPEDHARSFIVRCRAESPPPGEGREGWLCQVIQVPSGERHYIRDLDQLVDFLAPYLRDAGARLPPYWRFRLWLQEVTPQLRRRLGG